MKAVILAGGRGKRLGALSRYRPKPMLLIKGHPFLEYLLGWLKRYGITDIIISGGYLSEVIKEYFGRGEGFGVNIKYVIEKKPLGTAGALRKSGRYVGRDFILLNGDSFIDADLKSMIAYHYRKKNKITMAVTKTGNIKRYGRVEIDNKGRIREFSEKSGEGDFINAGVYICNEKLLNKIPDRIPVSLEKDVFPFLDRGWINAYRADGFFIDIGTVSDYRKLKFIKSSLFRYV